MKKILLILTLISFTLPVFADICYDINENISTKAVELLKNKKEIYEYCSICDEARPNKIIVHEIKKGNPITINNKGIDLAHMYYKKDKSFINLGVAAGCISADEYGIKAQLNSLPTIHHTEENSKIKAKKLANKIYNKCLEQKKNLKEPQTTSDMLIKNTLINDCLTAAIKKEIHKGFNPEDQEKMYQYLQQSKINIHKFYEGIYSFNKYCKGTCGTISELLPYVDEGRILENMLESLLYLNIEKNGY